ncbi:MAG: family 16 glycosylhydrolase [Saprospiraceae bacterium]|nr:family 16 glycosylhydrolase [Saprospiraceae bacterium]
MNKKDINLARVVLLGLIMGLSSQLCSQCPSLIWFDEFNGTKLDVSKWTYQIGDGCDIGLCQWGNNELQWYTSSEENLLLSGGTMKIVARKQTVQNRNYTSARIRSIQKGDIKYGRIEARMKLPFGQGIWPAFWMLPSEDVYGGWPQSGEIDIMEYLGHEPSTIHGTLHFGQTWPNNSSTTKSFTLAEGNFYNSFHDYALEWSEYEIKWYIDGYLYSSKAISDMGNQRWPFDQKFHFLFNLAVGGTWPGIPNATTVFPQIFEIDYIRVYDKTGQAHLSGPARVPSRAKNVVYALSNVLPGSVITWNVPEGTTFKNGQGSDSINLDWGSTGGKVMAVIKSSCGEKIFVLAVAVEPELVSSVVLENFDQESRIRNTFNTGILVDQVDNPNTNSINGSKKCGQYTRNPSQQYDVLVYEISDVKNASEFVTGFKRIYIDILTSAPVGTSLILQFENKNQASANYPVGRHSRYTTVTTKQNEWERLSFSFLDRPSNTVPDEAVDQLIFLFASNSFTGFTFYFDNLEIYAVNTVPVFENNQFTGLNIFPNPAYDQLNIISPPGNPFNQLEIMDFTGRTVKLQATGGTTEYGLSISGLDNGLYFIRIKLTNGIEISRPFIKQTQ